MRSRIGVASARRNQRRADIRQRNIMAYQRNIAGAKKWRGMPSVYWHAGNLDMASNKTATREKSA